MLNHLPSSQRFMDVYEQLVAEIIADERGDGQARGSRSAVTKSRYERGSSSPETPACGPADGKRRQLVEGDDGLQCPKGEAEPRPRRARR